MKYFVLIFISFLIIRCSDKIYLTTTFEFNETNCLKTPCKEFKLTVFKNGKAFFTGVNTLVNKKIFYLSKANLKTISNFSNSLKSEVNAGSYFINDKSKNNYMLSVIINYEHKEYHFSLNEKTPIFLFTFEKEIIKILKNKKLIL